MRQVLTTACPLDCPDGCSLAVTVDDGRIVSVDADKSADASPFTQGFICQKVKHHAERVYGPDRVLTPLIRTGEKGSGQFRSATWDEAIGLIASRVRTAIDTVGADAVVPYLYSSSAGVLASTGLTINLFQRLGCPDVAHTICAATAGAAWRQVYGSMLSADPFDIAEAKLIVLWGANPNASNTHLIPLINKAVKRNGATLVVVDPRRTGMAARADLHIAIRPGTDAPLAYAITNWLVASGRHDAEFIAEHVDGADEFIEAAREWTFEKAAEVCGVAIGDIERLAELVATDEPAMLRIGWGLERNRNGGSGYVGVLSLWALAGHFGQRGSGILASTGGAAPLDTRRLRPSLAEAPKRSRLSMNNVPLALAGELEDWPRTEVLFVQGANPAVTAMDQSRWLGELAREDLFTVVHDQVMTDTAAFADVVLPATTHFEAGDLAVAYGSFSMLRVNPVIDRVGESRSNDEVASALAIEMEMSAQEFDPQPAHLESVIRTDDRTGSVAELRGSGGTVQFIDTHPRFRDGSTRVRVFDPSSELPLPRYVPAATAGLTMLSSATNRTINSMFAEFDPPDIAVTISVADAAARGIHDGDLVRVFNELGEIEIVAKVDDVMRSGVVAIPKGLWRRSFAGGRTANTLIPLENNDLAGGACFNDARVEIAGIA
jgi:anaerobic selenocysteine-containing dehydrogenase